MAAHGQEAPGQPPLKAGSKPGADSWKQGVVTCVEKDFFYLQRDQRAWVISRRGKPFDVSVGDALTIKGKDDSAAGTPIVMPLEITRNGTSPLPDPISTFMPVLIASGPDNVRMRLRGSVHHVSAGKGRVHLWVEDVISSLTVTILTPEENPRRPDELLDAFVEITGISRKGTTLANRAGRTWSTMTVNSMEDVRVITPGHADVFSRPPARLGDLPSIPFEPYAQRIRVNGTVTYACWKRPTALWFYFQDETGTCRGRAPDFLLSDHDNVRPVLAPLDIEPGDVVEVTGYRDPRTPSSAMTWLLQCEWRVVKKGPKPPYPLVDLETVFVGGYDGKAVSMVGRVTDLSSKAEADGHKNHWIQMGGFNAYLEAPGELELPFKIGDAIRVRGPLRADMNTRGVTTGCRVNIHSVADIQRVPFAMDRSLFNRWVLGIAVTILVAGLWIYSLRRQVKRQTAKLSEANQELARFKRVAEMSSELVGMATLDRKPLYLNPAGRAMLGIPPDEDVLSMDFSSIYTPETLVRVRGEGLEHALQHGHWDAEVTLQHRDGRAIPVSFTGLVLRDDAGNPLCLSCTARDITGRIVLEHQLRESLDHERDLNQLKSSFVNTISHEFRTPLGIILFASSMMQRFNERYTAKQRMDKLRSVDEAVERMNDLVEQALSLGRAETAAPKLESVDLEPISRRIVDEVLSATSHRSPVELDVQSDVPSLRCDTLMLRTILGNLLNNAVKYSPPGSPVNLHIARQNGSVIFTVRDHGPGLHEEDMSKLFTSFHRGTNTENIPGTGLGLAIVKRCVTALGGDVAARNAEDGGAEFTVELPLESN